MRLARESAERSRVLPIKLGDPGVLPSELADIQFREIGRFDDWNSRPDESLHQFLSHLRVITNKGFPLAKSARDPVPASDGPNNRGQPTCIPT